MADCHFGQGLRPLVEDSRKLYSQQPLIWGVAVTRQFWLTRQQKTLQWKTGQLQVLPEGAGRTASQSTRAALGRPGPQSGGIKKNFSLSTEEPGKAARRAFIGVQALRTIARLDFLRKLHTRKIGSAAPVVDPETSCWRAKAIKLRPAVNSRWDDFIPPVTGDGRELCLLQIDLGVLARKCWKTARSRGQKISGYRTKCVKSGAQQEIWSVL